jgi:hypothetical protein
MFIIKDCVQNNITFSALNMLKLAQLETRRHPKSMQGI